MKDITRMVGEHKLVIDVVQQTTSLVTNLHGRVKFNLCSVTVRAVR